MNNPCRWLVILLVLGCSNLSESNGVIVALGLRLPSPAAVEQNDTLALVAYALDGNGDTVATPIYWRTLDSTSVDTISPTVLDTTGLTVVDSTGLVTTLATSGQARVQARVGSLRSGDRAADDPAPGPTPCDSPGRTPSPFPPAIRSPIPSARWWSRRTRPAESRGPAFCMK